MNAARILIPALAIGLMWAPRWPSPWASARGRPPSGNLTCRYGPYELRCESEFHADAG